VANSSGTVGKYLMSHPGAPIYGLFDERTSCHVGASDGQFLSQDGYAKDTHAGAGPGLFPTSGGVNPTFTVHALAARSASYLLENWNSLIR
jgi:hypothetical protein